MAKDELKTIKFQMMLSESEAKAIDDWGFANRIRSRAEAIRRLCQIGLAVEDQADRMDQASADAPKLAIRLLTWMQHNGEGEDNPDDPVDLSLRLTELSLNAAAAISAIRSAQVIQTHHENIDQALEMAARLRDIQASRKEQK